MYSKKKRAYSSFRIPFCCLLFTLYSLLFTPDSFPQIIDRIVAVVNDQVITLTDLRIAEAFGLYEGELEGESEKPLILILERMVNQKIVVDAISENISVEREELEAGLRKVTERLGPEGFQKRQQEFGLRLEGLKDYLEEKILYQKILSRRFSKSLSVNLEEIKNHYRKTYVPSQEKKGLKPRPMMEVLDEIESAIKQEKMKRQIADWINNLKKRAEIEIRLDI